MLWRLTGEWLDGKHHGWGLLSDVNGVYEGEFVGGVRHGQGCMAWKNGDLYRGQWLDDQPHGIGQETVTGLDGVAEVYIGSFRSGLRDGSGTVRGPGAGDQAVTGTWRAGLLVTS